VAGMKKTNDHAEVVIKK